MKTLVLLIALAVSAVAAPKSEIITAGQTRIIDIPVKKTLTLHHFYHSTGSAASEITISGISIEGPESLALESMRPFKLAGPASLKITADAANPATKVFITYEIGVK